jgi:Ca2+-binding RTX toxin-like protein
MTDPRKISTQYNLWVIGAGEGTYYNVPGESKDQRYKASFAKPSISALSFGLTQLDVGSRNPIAKKTYADILNRAVADDVISLEKGRELYALAIKPKAKANLGTDNIALLNTIFARPDSILMIDRADLQRANSLGVLLEQKMNDASAHWTALGKAAAWNTDWNTRLTMYGYIAATVNRADSTLQAIDRYLRGKPVTVMGKVFQASEPPTTAQLIDFLHHFKMWQEIPANWTNLRARLDPTLDAIQLGQTGTKVGLLDDVPPELILAAMGASGSSNLFSLAYRNPEQQALVWRTYGFDPADAEILAFEEMIAAYGADDVIDTLSLTEEGQTYLLNMAQLEMSAEQLKGLFGELAPKLKVENLDSLLAWDDTVTGGGYHDLLAEAFVDAYIDADGNLVISGFTSRTIDFDPRKGSGQYAIEVGLDSYGREISQDWVFYVGGGPPTDTEIRRIRDGQVEIYSEPGEPTTIRLLDSLYGIDFVDAAETIVSVFGNHFIGGNALVQTVTSAGLKTLASNFGDILNTAVFDTGVATSKNMDLALDGMGAEFLQNLKVSGISTLSAYLTAELVSFVGLEGFEAQALNSIAGSVINRMVSNLAEMALGTPDVGLFTGVADLAQLGNVAGAFLGNHLASKVGNWDELGEQLGSSIGGALGAAAGQVMLPIPVLGAIVGAFLGNLMGGLIGGVFTGTPKSGAIVEFDEAAGLFAVGTVWKEDGGKKRVARELGNTAAEALNGIVTFIDGELVNGRTVGGGSYGMRGKRYVYWEDGVESDNRVKFKEPGDLIEYGVLQAAIEFKFLGGDVYAKRAFYATLAAAGVLTTTPETGGAESSPGQLFDGQPITTVEFTLDSLLANFAVVERLHEYLQSPATINALIAAEPDSGFAADWLLTFARIEELGLWRRNSHDWDGGFRYLIKKAEVDAQDASFAFDTFADGVNGERVISLAQWTVTDTVDSRSKTIVSGTAEDDRLWGAPARTGHIANVLRGGDGDDELVAAGSGDDLFGGAGNDRLTGGILDDWLYGGSGDDVLDAGGGNGNVLTGDTGDDIVTGADGAAGADQGSDWLVGGSGNDVVKGRGGDDYLEGSSEDDDIDGGGGSDTIIYRSGDGIDRLADTGLGVDEHDVLEFGREIDAQEATVVARSAGESLSIFLSELVGAGRIDLRGVAFGDTSGMDEYRFGDETWSRGDLTGAAIFSKTAGATVAGTSADESLTGTLHDDEMTGGGGTDLLAGAWGSDVYTFNLGDGAVTIDDSGFAADVDTLVFGAGIALADIVIERDPAARDTLVLRVGATADRVLLAHQSIDDGEGSIEEIRFADGTRATLRDLYAIYLAPPFTAGADTKRGLDADDAFQAGEGDDIIEGGRGRDYLEGQHGADTYVYNRGDGEDVIFDVGNLGNYTTGDRLQLGAGFTLDNLLFRRDATDGHNLRLAFSDRNGSITIDNEYGGVNAGVETIELADGTVITRQQMIDRSIAQASTVKSDLILGDHGVNAISAGAGDDRVLGWGGDDDLTGGTGRDRIEGAAGADIYRYNAGDGADWIYDLGDYGDYTPGDELVLGTGLSAASMQVERDWLDAKNVRISFGAAGDSILLEDELDYGHATIDLLRFADGTIVDRAGLAALSIAQASSAGGDRIVGSQGVDVISAGGGDDRVYGWDGNDTITGGTGDDELQGGAGADTYVYAPGDGNDTIWDMGNFGQYTAGDRLLLTGGITASSLILEHDGNDGTKLRIRFAGAAGSILLDHQLANGYGAVETIEFDDGTIWDRTRISDETLAQSISGLADYIEGTSQGDTIDGGAGNDRIHAWDGNDTLRGGAGNDNLEGGAGGDTYRYGAGDGDDRIYDIGNFALTTAGDRLAFDSGIDSTHVILSRDSADGNNLIVRFNNRTGSILIDNQFVNSGGGVESIEFDDGTVWLRSEIETRAPALITNAIDGTEFTDSFNGTSGADIVRGFAGNDFVSGGAGADRIEGGGGNDLYRFSRGHGADYAFDSGGTADVLRFGDDISPNDIRVTRRLSDFDSSGITFSIIGTYDEIHFASFDYDLNGYDHDIERIEFDNGTVWTIEDVRDRLFSNATAGDDVIVGTTSGADQLAGLAGDDRISSGWGGSTIEGGLGNDRIDDSGGGDTYLYARGDGIDTINENGGNDILRFAAGIAATDVKVTRRMFGDDFGIVLSISGWADQIYLVGAGYNRYGENHIIERIEFHDGIVWTDADLRGRLAIDMKTAGDDYIVGSTWDGDVLSGGAGDDQLRAYDGNDSLDGGAGQDLLEGGTGNDSYVFNLGDGRDVIDEEGGDDRLTFGQGIDPDDVKVTTRFGDWDARGLVFSIAGGDDEIYVREANYSLNGKDQDIESVLFADGTIWTAADVRAKLFAGGTTQGDDYIFGSTFSGDVLVGGGGDDHLLGDVGDDRIEGGKGEDRLEGGGGNDVYLYHRGDGYDVVDDEGGPADILRFGSGITEADVKVSRKIGDDDEDGIVFSIAGTGDSLYVMEWNYRLNGRDQDLERIEFQDGAVWTPDMVAMMLEGSAVAGADLTVSMGDDDISGSAGADTIRAMHGDDHLRGGAGSDTYVFALGDGYDTIYDADQSGATDRLVLEGIDSSDVKVFISPTDADDVVLYIDDSNLIYLDQQVPGSNGGVEEVVFADSVTWTRQILLDKAAGAQATDGDDVLIGSNFADVLEGGLGNDELLGRAGNDVYVYNPGDGADVIDERDSGTSAAAAGGDTIRFGEGITAADLVLARSGTGDLLLTFASGPGSILLRNQDSAVDSGIERIELFGGTVVTMASLVQQMLDLLATSGDDLITGFGRGDLLRGGLGNDILAGGGGEDIYRFETGFGIDTIVESSEGADILDLGAGIAAADIRLQRLSSFRRDLILIIGAAGDKIVLKDQFAGAHGGVDRVQFDDGSAWTREQLLSRAATQAATAEGDFLLGGAEANSYDGLAGDDLVEGGDGDDILTGGLGADDLSGGRGIDQVYGGDGDDTISGGSGRDTLDGGLGFDIADYNFSLDGWSIDLGSGQALIRGSAPETAESITGFEGAVGGAGEDLITGDGGSNRLRGAEGDDELEGGGGDDVFVYDGQEEGADSVSGGAGLDRIEAASDETVIGLQSLAGVETVTAAGFAGVTIAATDEADSLDLSGAELIGIVSINLGMGDDVLTGSAGADTIDAALGDDVIRYVGSSTGGDVVDGGDGQDRIEAGADNAVIGLHQFESVETITGAGFANVVVAGTGAVEDFDLSAIAVSGIHRFDLGGGDDHFVGTSAADTVRGGAGDDTLSTGSGDDSFEFAEAGSGLDTIDGGAGADVLAAAAAGAVIGIRSISGIEAIEGRGFANVELRLTGLADTLNLAAVTVTGLAGIRGGEGDDILRGSEGADTFRVSGTADGYDDVDGGSGTDRIEATAAGTVIGVKRLVSVEQVSASGHANVTLAGTGGVEALDLRNVTLDGIGKISLGAGADTIEGSAGADTIDGGAGNDRLSGNQGNDTYLFNLGGGQDTISEEGPGGVGGGTDVLQFGAGIDPTGVTVTKVNGDQDYLFTIGGGADRVLVVKGAAEAANFWLEEVRFHNGTAWTRQYIATMLASYSAGDDVINGTTGADVVRGGGGNDTLDGKAGDDTLVGGPGNDLLYGGQGNDTYVFNRGDGQDTLREWYSSGTNGIETIQFGAGILSTELVVTTAANGEHLVLTLGTSTDKLTLEWEVNTGSQRFEQFRFEDDTLTHAEVMALASVGGPGNDVLYGSYDVETLSGGAGNDTLDGKAGNDTIIGGLGNDLLYGGAGDDVYVFNRGDGQDTLREWYSSGTGGVDTIQFGQGIVETELVVTQANNGEHLVISIGSTDKLTLEWDVNTGSQRFEQVRFHDTSTLSHATLMSLATTPTAGADVFYGSYDVETLSGGAGNDTLDARSGNDTIIGGLGNDILHGGAGDDVYVFNRGDGQDSLREWYFSGTAGGVDTIQFGQGIVDTELVVTQASDGNHLVISIGSTDKLTLEWDVNTGSQRFEQVRLHDTTFLTHAQLMALSMTPTAGADVFYGSYDVETMSGGAGNDMLDARAGNDTITGGLGNDLLYGGQGDDTYVFNRGDGQDTLREWYSAGTGGFDTIQFGTGIHSTELVVTTAANGEHLVLTLGTSTDKLTLEWAVNTASQRFEQVVFGDATLTHAQVMSLAFTGGSGDDTLFGSNDGETITGGAGNDTLDGRAGNDSLSGNAGSDVLIGGTGNDTYFFNRGDGLDTVRDTGSGTDLVRFGPGILTTEISVGKAGGGADYVFYIGDGEDAITLAGGVTGGASSVIEDVRFEDNTVWNVSTFAGRVVPGSNGADLIAGTAAADSTRSFGGNDRIAGAAGADTLRGGGGDDTLQGDDGNDVLHGGAGEDLLVGETLVATGSNLLDNGSFETSGTVVSTHSWGKINSTLPSWTKTNSQNFEQTLSGTQGVSATQGSYWLDLDSGGGAGSNMEISQTVGSLADGQVLLLQFDHANRASAASGPFEVYWNGRLIASISDTGTAMVTKSLEVRAVAGDNVVGFKGLGTTDNAGASLDNVRLFATVDGNAGDDLLVGGAGNDLLRGGLGTDTAQFAGALADYQLTTSGGLVSLADLQPSLDGDDGTDALVGIETLLFKNGETLSLAAPIILDLDGNGTELVSSARSSARFDMDGDGKLDETSWFGAGDAMLFLDRDGNGTVTNAGEFSFSSDAPNGRSDLEGLRTFDSNGDGKLGAGDARIADFRLWQDRNGDGSAAASEILTFAAAKVAGIDLAGTPTSLTAAPGNAVAVNLGSFTKLDGSKGQFADAVLSYYSGGAAASETPITMSPAAFERKSKRYEIAAEGGRLLVRLKKAGTVDPAAGAIGPATLLSFSDKAVGLLSPIVLDLDGDGVELRSRKESKARFDMDGDGSRDDTGWVGRGDGLLVIDRNGDGLITTSAELSFLAERPGAGSDLEGLAALDSNSDGRIDATDLRFGELKVWLDSDRDGITDAGELRSLGEAGIASIGLAGTATQQSVKPGENLLLATGTFTLADGTVRTFGDAALAFKPSGGAASAATSLAADLDPSLEAIAAALRSGLNKAGSGSGLSFRVPDGIDPFDYFTSTPSDEVAAHGPVDLEALAPDPRIALMAQDIAVFGSQSGEAGPTARQNEPGRYEYFA